MELTSKNTSLSMKTIVTTFFLSALTGTAAYVVVPLVPVPHDGLLAQLHNEWKAKYDVSYDNEEVEAQRRAVFADNLQYVSAHNERFNRGEIGFDMKLNVHADRTYSEWEDMLLSYTKRNVTIIDQEHHLGLHSTHLRQDLPTHVDWREQGAVTEVKNQGQCGSCWSFSTTGSIEGANFLKTGSLISLSEEMLINCVNGGEFDCQTGGDMVEAFKFVIKNGGIVAEETEPYESQDHEKCKYKGGNTKYPVSITGYKTIPTNDEDALKSAVAGRPVAVAIDASHRSFQFYHSGVYDDEECCTDCQLSDLDHGVLAVGYGTEKGKDYWLIKNSWSADWGDAGYIKILRNDKDRCGVATEASYPVA